MRTLTVNIPEDVYRRLERRAAERGASIDEEVMELIGRGDPADVGARLADTRARMQELFRTVTGFRMGPKFTREELYDRKCFR
jgi:hypothetical protein